MLCILCRFGLAARHGATGSFYNGSFFVLGGTDSHQVMSVVVLAELENELILVSFLCMYVCMYQFYLSVYRIVVPFVGGRVPMFSDFGLAR